MKKLIFAILAILIVSGCGLTLRDNETLFDAMRRQRMQQRYGQRAYMSYRRAIPVAPTRVGFHRPPVHWEGNAFGLRIINQTHKYHVRCVIDGQEHQRTVRGRVLRAYIKTRSGIKTAALIPPGETSYLISNGGRHNMRCELYGGPVRVMPNGAYVFRKVKQKWIHNFTVDQFPNRTYYINQYQILNYKRL